MSLQQLGRHFPIQALLLQKGGRQKADTGILEAGAFDRMHAAAFPWILCSASPSLLGRAPPGGGHAVAGRLSLLLSWCVWR